MEQGGAGYVGTYTRNYTVSYAPAGTKCVRCQLSASYCVVPNELVCGFHMGKLITDRGWQRAAPAVPGPAYVSPPVPQTSIPVYTPW